MSGVFAVTFSVIFAYVADITQEHERSTAYGLVRRRSTKTQSCVLNALRNKFVLTISSLLPPGICYLRSQPGHQPGHRSLLVCDLRRHLGGDPGHGHRAAGHLLHPGGRTGVAAGEDEASVVGSTHLLGTGGPLRRE